MEELEMSELQNHAVSPRAIRRGVLGIVAVAVLSGLPSLSWAEPKPASPAQTPTTSEPARSTRALADGSNPWFLCGSLAALQSCSLASFPTDVYEYGFKYNSSEALAASCLFWNVGFRLINRNPYIIFSDNPTDGSMRFGGAMFYTGTNASDDDVPSQCPGGFWRQRYWYLDANNVPQTIGSNGCVNLDLYCRLR
jgi:hypothetical protein